MKEFAQRRRVWFAEEVVVEGLVTLVKTLVLA